VKGAGNQQDYGMRIYDPRVGRFLSVDPLTGNYPELTPYQFASNNPVEFIDIDGLEKGKPQGQENPFTYFKRVMDNLEAGIKEQYHNLEAAALRADAKHEGLKPLNKMIVAAMKNPAPLVKAISNNLDKQAQEAMNDGLTYLYLTASGQNKKGSAFLGKKLAIYGPMILVPEEEAVGAFEQRELFSIPKDKAEVPLLDWDELRNRAIMSENPLSVSVSSNGKVFRAVIQNIESEYGGNVWKVMSDFMKQAKAAGAARIEVKGIEIVNDDMNRIFQEMNGKKLMGYEVHYTRNGSYGEVDLIKDIPKKK
jgi:hypothetical protein